MMVSLGKGIGGHTLPNRGRTNDWITPKYIIDALGPFHLDPCQSLTQPWPCARRGYTIRDNGLTKRWKGRTWVNPPYGREAWAFIEKLAEHRNGIGLLFGRTETAMFQQIWEQADGLLFLLGRLTFYKPNGQKAGGNSGGPSVLVAFGEQNVEALRNCNLPGYITTQWSRCGPIESSQGGHDAGRKPDAGRRTAEATLGHRRGSCSRRQPI